MFLFPDEGKTDGPINTGEFANPRYDLYLRSWEDGKWAKVRMEVKQMKQNGPHNTVLTVREVNCVSYGRDERETLLELVAAST